MSYLTPIDQVKQLSQRDGDVIFFQTDTFGKRSYALTAAANGSGAGTNTGGDIIPYQPIISEVTMAVQTNSIDVQNMKNNPTPNKPALGMNTVTGGFQQIATATDMEYLLQLITQDPNPTVTYRGGGNNPAQETIVATSALGTQATPVTHTVTTIPNTFKWPVQITATLSGTPGIDSAATRGTVTITGTDYNGNTRKTELRWTTATLTNLSMTTDDYLDPTQTITVVSKGFSAGMLTVTVDDPSKGITFTPHKEQKVFGALEDQTGGVVPESFMDWPVESVEFGVTPDQNVVFNVTPLVPFGRVRKNINGGTTVTTKPTGVQHTKGDIFNGTESYLEIQGQMIAMETMTVSITNGFILPFFHPNSQWSESRPSRENNRVVTINCTLPYAESQDFESAYIENETITDVTAVLKNSGKTSFGAYNGDLRLITHKGTQMSMPSAQGTNRLNQNVVIQAYTDGDEDDYSIEYNVPKQNALLYNYS